LDVVSSGELVPRTLRLLHSIAVKGREELAPLFGGDRCDPPHQLFSALEIAEETGRTDEAGPHVEDVAVLVQNVVEAIAGDGALDAAAVAEVDRHVRRGPYRLPVENPAASQAIRDRAVRVERGPEVAAVRTAELLVEVS